MTSCTRKRPLRPDILSGRFREVGLYMYMYLLFVMKSKEDSNKIVTTEKRTVPAVLG